MNVQIGGVELAVVEMIGGDELGCVWALGLINWCILCLLQFVDGKEEQRKW